MEEKGKVLGIVPFIGIMKTLLNNEKTELRCGAGINTFTITTSGKITACPIAQNSNGTKSETYGNLNQKNSPTKLLSKNHVQHVTYIQYVEEDAYLQTKQSYEE